MDKNFQLLVIYKCIEILISTKFRNDFLIKHDEGKKHLPQSPTTKYIIKYLKKRRMKTFRLHPVSIQK